MSTIRLLEECRAAGVTLSPALEFEGPEAALAAGLEACLQEGKLDVIRVLVGSAASDPRAGWFGSDWRFEWVQELGLLYLRLLESPDPEVKALYRELLAETPRTRDEWLILGGIIRDAESDLRRAGKLPPIPNFGP
jgi:hypothetical protein